LADDSRPDDIVQIVRDIGGLHATSAKSPYLSLFSRVADFTRDKLNEELYVKRSLGKIRCMRKTVYILPGELIPVAFSATRRMIELTSERYSRYLGVTEKEYSETSKLILKVLKGEGMTAKEIREALGTELSISAILNLMCDQGLLIRGNPRKGWKSNIHTYRLLHDYFPDMNLNKLGEERATVLLVKHYLRSFGPVTDNDIVWWIGVNRTRIREALRKIREQTVLVKIEAFEDNFIMLRSDKDRIERTNLPRKRIVNLLPGLDPYLMGYKERRRYLDYQNYEKVFDRSGNATSTILIDGRVAGVWDFADDEEPLVKIFLFDRVEESVLDEIYLKAQGIGRFIADKEVKIRECDSMIPLTRRTAGGVMSPLRGS
jgi:hypothetical protein